MVNFCQKCGNLLVPQYKKHKKVGTILLYCNLCRRTETTSIDGISYKVKTRFDHKENEKPLIFDEDFSVDPIIRQFCPKCGFSEAYYWQGGNRRKLEWEPMTFYRCRKCKNTWND